MKGSNFLAVVFTDLDGTLLDEEYSYSSTNKIVNRLLKLNVALVICSSKTSVEIEHYQRELGVDAPFISENGAAIFIPKEYFSHEYTFTRQTSEYNIIEFGTRYDVLRRKLKEVQEKTGAIIVGFGDLQPNELAEESGLSLEIAKLAKQREYDEPFRIVKGDKQQIFTSLKQEGLIVSEGDRYCHLMGKHNKGIAVSYLKKLYFESVGQVITFGVGNGPNDLEMLKAVDKSFFVTKTEQMTEVWEKLLAEVLQVAANLKSQ